MYKLQLIRKYLFKRRIAWVALVAVMLCTAMVLVVVSVMGGWLRAFEESFHGMTGDVVITANSLGGFPNYQEMIDGIKKLPDATGAVPVIRTWALMNLGDQGQQAVQVLGYPPDIGSVNEWPSSLHLKIEDRRKDLEKSLAQPDLTDDQRAHLQNDLKELPFGLHPEEDYGPERHGLNPRDRPGLIVSSSVVGLGRNKGGDEDSRNLMYHFPVALTLVPVKGGESITPESVQPVPFWIVDDAKSRVWQLDNNNVYISFDEAQKDLGMAGTNGVTSGWCQTPSAANTGTNVQSTALANNRHGSGCNYAFADGHVKWLLAQNTYGNGVPTTPSNYTFAIS